MNTLLDESTFIYEENEDPQCSGCLQYIEDGSVIQFGEGVWHFECFRCAKCHKLVECYNNLLLLRDGSPICEDCSYVCHACGKAIKAEAIMTGEEAYHAECFRCAHCNIKIEDLVFTQTSKGIFCTQCHEARKQQRQRRKEEKMQQQLQTLPQEPLRHEHDTLNKSPSLSRGNLAPRWQKPQEECNSENTRSSPSTLKSRPEEEKRNSKNFILSANELAELNQMLNNAIESNLNDDIPAPYSQSEHIPSPPRTRGSVSPSSDATFLSLNSNDYYEFDADDAIVNDKAARNEKYIKDLEQELAHTKNRLYEVDSKFNKIKTISRKALDEFHAVKEGYAAEVAARQEAEVQAARLKSELAIWHQTSLLGSEETIQMLKAEIAHLSRSKAELEKACADLQTLRDRLTADISNDILSRVSVENGASDLQKSLKQQLQSFKTDIDIAKASYARLIKARDDIISEMIMLNTKNAELTSLNNDLSRRVTEREREAIAVMAGTSFLGADEADKEQEHRKSEENVPGDVAVSLERKSSDHQNVRKVAQRDSISKAEPPKMFKFRRNKGGNVFGRKGQSNKKSAEEMTIGLPYDATTSQPFNFTNENTKPKNSSSDVKELVDSNLKNRAGHSFTQTRFLRPAKCEICADKIWRASELKCQRCGYVCHFKCMHNVSAACAGKNSMDSSRNLVEQTTKLIFGNDLAAQVQLEKGTIPLVVQKCIEAVEARGMDFEGIYRKSGAAGQMRQIQQCFEKGEAPDLSDEDKWNDICAVTSVLKQYFRDLPDPLFTYDLHAQFMEASVASADQQFAQFQKSIHSLPAENYYTLKFLMQHLDKIQQQQSENLMTARNLAVVFGPTLMRDRDESRDLVDMNRKITAIEYILNHVPALFADPSPNHQNHSSPLPTARRNSLVRGNHRRDYSTDDILRAFPPAVPPRENANYI